MYLVQREAISLALRDRPIKTQRFKITKAQKM